MSLEEALAENTAVMKQLIAVMSTVAEAGGAPVPPGPTSENADTSAPAKRTRRTKEQIAADEAAAAAAAAVKNDGYLLPGDPAGTRYFHIPDSRTTYKQLPGQPDCTVPSAVIISGAEYASLSEGYAKNGHSVAAAAPATGSAAPNASAPTPAASPAPAATTQSGSAPTMQSITAKLMAVHKRDGNAGVKPILDKFGVTNVPALATKNLVEVDAAVEAVLNPATGANLFG